VLFTMARLPPAPNARIPGKNGLDNVLEKLAKRK
jgi:hypothetical protein